jgi:acetylglutamate/LysW-gamma-L-alpha-aminoadipate kinase
VIVVIKIGGALIAENFQNVVRDIANLYLNYGEKYTLIILHGGGPQINETLRKMNKEPKYFQTPSGFKTRYTDQEAIKAAIMAVGGLNNKRLTEALQKEGVNAFGFTGIDGGIIKAKRKEKILILHKGKRIMKRGEYSGKVKAVDKGLLKYLLKNGYLPVIGSLAKSGKGEIVNVDGDRAAGHVANALDAELLISLTDVKGIYRDFEEKASLIQKLNINQLEPLLEGLKGGMKKKAYAALEAFEVNENKTLKRVIISSGLSENPIFDVLERNKGTTITNE